MRNDSFLFSFTKKSVFLSQQSFFLFYFLLDLTHRMFFSGKPKNALNFCNHKYLKPLESNCVYFKTKVNLGY